jgi:hypothetical protein
VIEPHLFETDYIIEEKINARTNAGKALRKEFKEKADGKIIISHDMLEEAKKVADAVLEHPHTAALMNGAVFEKSLYWVNEETGLLCKARPDIWNKEINVLCDLKTAANASMKTFLHEARQYDYHIQAAMQIDAVYALEKIQIEQFAFLVAPKERPHKPYLFMLDEQTIQQGRREYKDGLKLAKHCFDNDCWDAERNRTMSVGFTEHQLSTNPFHQLMEIYQCPT